MSHRSHFRRHQRMWLATYVSIPSWYMYHLTPKLPIFNDLTGDFQVDPHSHIYIYPTIHNQTVIFHVIPFLQVYIHQNNLNIILILIVLMHCIPCWWIRGKQGNKLLFPPSAILADFEGVCCSILMMILKSSKIPHYMQYFASFPTILLQTQTQVAFSTTKNALYLLSLLAGGDMSDQKCLYPKQRGISLQNVLCFLPFVCTFWKIDCSSFYLKY